MFTILFGGLLYYSLPLVIGKISLLGVVMNQSINPIVYMVYGFAFIASLCFMIKSDNKKKPIIKYETRGYLNKLTSKRINFLTVFIFSVFLIGVFQLGFSNYLVASKSTNEERIALIQISVVLSMIMLPVSLFYRKWISLAVYFFILFSFLLYGARSYFVVTLISCAFVMFRFNKIRLISKFPLFILGIAFAIGMAIFKYIYAVVKGASLGELASIIGGLNYDLVMAQLIGDPTAVIYNLNYSINHDINLSIEYLFHRIFSIVPGGGDFFSLLTGENYPRYSAILANQYVDIHWGLASSLYAELIAISGFLGFIIIYLLMNKIVSNFNNNILTNGLSFFNLIYISSFTYLLFYSHRLDITFVLGIFKFCILIWVLFRYILVLRPEYQNK
ncbi:O-antigen polymerase [Flavobacterium sp. NKUCC04_CG]|uniref:O-antigen polymerase n=1 Tax=Flavobacterium sp. NKUCC04_CG TaxID=2842121 RepID=UPI001C5B5E4C|nr:O-antigen polymerase [Flavobacterium sp. NKUCC04_CG]MBW3517564.1 oligosaccharide repeat unit polymerase [Flavobacterium sp. NKUCC04_CG]